MSATQRKLTVMFADVSGSTALFEKLGDREAMHAVERCLKRMKRSIDGYKGRTIQIVGDELLAAFDSAEEACQAAIDMQQRIADLPPVSGLKLTIRIGLHCGVVAESEDKLSGPAVATAARIAGIARRDQILCSSELVKELPQPGIITADPMPKLGTVAESGTELELFQIHWPSYQGGSYPMSTFGPSSHLPVERLCIRYRGKAFLVDEKTPVLTHRSRSRLQAGDRRPQGFPPARPGRAPQRRFLPDRHQHQRQLRQPGRSPGSDAAA